MRKNENFSSFFEFILAVFTIFTKIYLRRRHVKEFCIVIPVYKTELDCIEQISLKRLNEVIGGKGYDVYFQTGTDEHGQKIELKAQDAGVSPQEFVDGVAAQIKDIWDMMNTSYDKFIRTTDKDHEEQVQKMFKYMYEKGDIYKGYYEGMYCTPCESFFTESQLVDGKCPDCGRDVQPAKEENWMLLSIKLQSVKTALSNIDIRLRKPLEWQFVKVQCIKLQP